MTAPPREICANCGQPKSAHYIVNFADGPQISGPVWLCTGGVYATPAPSAEPPMRKVHAFDAHEVEPPAAQPAEPPATDAPCSSCGQTAGFHTLRCRDKNAASELRATHCSNEGLHDSAADLIERQTREIARLDARNLELCHGWSSQNERAERAEAERDAMHADAERYRAVLVDLIDSHDAYKRAAPPLDGPLPKEWDRWQTAWRAARAAIRAARAKVEGKV